MTSRRELLLGSGAAMLPSLAGCVGFLEDGEDTERDPIDWFPASIAGYDEPFVGFGHLADAVEIEAVANSYWGHPIMGVDPSDIETFFWGGSADPEYRLDAMVGDFAADPIRARTEDRRQITLEDAGEYGEFDRYDYPDSEQVLGVTEGVAIDTEEELFEAVVDARAGDTQRLIDDHEDFQLLVDSTGDFDFMQGNVGWHEDDGATVTGESRAIGSDETELSRLAVYPSESDASAAERDRRAEAENDYPLSDVEVTIDGRVLVVSGMVDTVELF